MHIRRLPFTGALSAARILPAILNPNTPLRVPAGTGYQSERKVRLFCSNPLYSAHWGQTLPPAQRRAPCEAGTLRAFQRRGVTAKRGVMER